MSATAARIPELEGIRGVLSMLVVSGHIYAAPIFWYPGCMEFFFVISGFLITRILLNAPRLSADYLKTYAVRRMLRIWPMYFVALIVYTVVNALVMPHIDFQWHGPPVEWTMTWQPVAMSALFLQYSEAFVSFPGFSYAPLFGHSWSVAVEEQFYFLWPLLLIAIMPASRHFKLLLAAMAIGAAVTFRCVTYVLFDATVGMNLLPCRLDSFAFGICLAHLLRPGMTTASAQALSRPLVLTALAGLMILLPYLFRGYGQELFSWRPALERTLLDPTLGFSVLAFAAIGLVVIHSGSGALVWLRSPPLMWLGTISYSTYLMHILIIVLVIMLFTHYKLESLWLQWGVSVGLSVGLSHLTYTYIEAKALLLKNRFNYTAADCPIELQAQTGRVSATQTV